MTEEERALLFRERSAARCRARCKRLEALEGDKDAREALGLAWQPLYLALLEAGTYIDPEAELLCACP